MSGAVPGVPTRRTFLLGSTAAGAAGLVLAACGASSHSSIPPTTPGLPAVPGAATADSLGAQGSSSADLQMAASAASLENLIVSIYHAGLQAAAAGRLGQVPPAVTTFAMTALSQHRDHTNAWNAMLTGAGKPAVTTPDPAVAPPVHEALSKVTDVTGWAELALLLENTAAQSYQAAIPTFADHRPIQVAASIHPVEMQHAAILYFLLGRYPGIQGTADEMYSRGSPLGFNPIDLARPSSDFPGSSAAGGGAGPAASGS